MSANPLAIGVFCDHCGTRLQVTGDQIRPCPFGPHEEKK